MSTNKNYSDLSSADFYSSSLWISVQHLDSLRGIDSEADEVAYQSLGSIPAFDRLDPLRPRVLASAAFHLACGRCLLGFLSLPMSRGSVSDIQPQIFHPEGGRTFSFYKPSRRAAVNEKQRITMYLSAINYEVFPIKYEVTSEAVTPALRGSLYGCYFRENGVEVFV